MIWSRALIATSLLASSVSAARYEEYILAPSSRTLRPTAIYQVNGTVDGENSLVGDRSGSAIFRGPSAVTLDFGKNIAGLFTLNVGDVDSDQFIGVTFSESSLWISGEGSDATADAGIDETLWFAPTGPGDVTPDDQYERGGFRYLSLIHNTTGNIEITAVTVHFTPMPHYADDQLRDYTGYFHCDDELLNRIWYAGAYTNQLCTIDPKHGSALVHLNKITSTMSGDETPPQTWYNNYTITNGTSALVDGAKRDRMVWAGDMSIAVPALVVSTDDLISVANSLDSLFNVQNKTSGLLPYAGIPFNAPYVSFTYHLYTLIGVADHYLYSGSLDYLQGKWDGWKLGLNFSLSHIDSSGMMNVTSGADWLRSGMSGHNIEANSILYYTINQGIMLGKAVGEDQTLLDSWATTAATVKAAANDLLWVEAEGMYKDNETTTLMPQDGNSWAVVANITDSADKMSSISQNLAARWGPYGAPAVEAYDAVSPFVSGFELQAHSLAGNVSAALALMRLQWGFMLDDPRMTNSTFIEGYASDGRLHYAPYSNDPRVSHAHGWATGPTSTLVFYVGGIHLTAKGGKEWEMAPRLGDLTFVDTGFQTSVGSFASQVNASESGAITGFTFMAPAGTNGEVSLPGVAGRLVNGNGTSVPLLNGEASDVPGGSWTLILSSNSTGGASPSMPLAPAQQTGGAAATLSKPVLAALFAAVAYLW